jgi:predicted Rossmann fold flavoprotein
MQKEPEKFDVAVIGGGAAGLMAAGRAAELGARVILIEKNDHFGKKILITGKGRCNITQAEFDDKKIIEKLGKEGKFLFSALAAFGPEEVIAFFEGRGLATKRERGGRVFPVSDKAQDVINVLQSYITDNRVKKKFGAQAVKLRLIDGKITHVVAGKDKIYADKFIVCTGGLSYSTTGSTGDGYAWARECGHTIIKTAPALVPVKTREKWVTDLQGLSLKNVAVNVFQNNKKQDSRFGEMLFTHVGVSGPIVLDLSKKIGELLGHGEVLLEIDLKPALEFSQLDERLKRDFAQNINKDFKNYLPDLLPQKMVETIIELSGIDPKKKVNLISKVERKKLVGLLKGLRATVDGLVGYHQAIITSGGVDLREVDSKTMRSKKVSNLFFAGEILNLDGPTGGYNLQISWSTGYAAGTAAAQK